MRQPTYYRITCIYPTGRPRADGWRRLTYDAPLTVERFHLSYCDIEDVTKIMQDRYPGATTLTVEVES